MGSPTGLALILKSKKQADLKPALDYFLARRDRSQCAFVTFFTSSKALAEFNREDASNGADNPADKRQQFLDQNYLVYTDNPNSAIEQYIGPVLLPNGKWDRKMIPEEALIPRS